MKFRARLMHYVSVIKSWSVFYCVNNFIHKVHEQQDGPVLIFVTIIRVASLEERECLRDRLEFVRNQLNLLVEDIKKKIKMVSEQVANQVEMAEWSTTMES